MTDSKELRQQKYERFQELFALSRQRYLEAGGDPRKCPSGRKGDDYLTDEEREELFAIGRELGNVKIIGDEVHTAGRSWKITAQSNK
ncbi:MULTISPECIES: hypothetical protein [Aerosakkonema]|uniref:hypothetical protein n=1 Tax=Aerosakkonema TaxID=1246629 RepID=UPI0035BA7743